MVHRAKTLTNLLSTSDDLEEFIESIIQDTDIIQDEENVEELIRAKKDRIE